MRWHFTRCIYCSVLVSKGRALTVCSHCEHSWSCSVCLWWFNQRRPNTYNTVSQYSSASMLQIRGNANRATSEALYKYYTINRSYFTDIHVIVSNLLAVFSYILQYSRKYVYLISCRDWDEKSDTTNVIVKTGNRGEQPALLSLKFKSSPENKWTCCILIV